MAGTLRENKPELLSKRIRPVNSSEFLFRSLQILGVLHATERENVVVIGTLHRYRIKRRKKRTRNELQCHKRKSRQFRQLATGYSCKRLTLHWPLVVFFNILDNSEYNIFVIWMVMNKSGTRRRPRGDDSFLRS